MYHDFEDFLRYEITYHNQKYVQVLQHKYIVTWNKNIYKYQSIKLSIFIKYPEKRTRVFNDNWGTILHFFIQTYLRVLVHENSVTEAVLMSTNNKWATSWENLFMPYANNKGIYQPAHPRSLISTFVARCWDSIIPLVSISEISSLYLASVAAQTGLRQHWSQTPFSHDMAHMFLWRSVIEPPHDKTNKWLCAQQRQISLDIHPDWSESSLCALWVAKDPSFLHADSEDTDQTGRMPRLIWILAGRICHFVGLVMRWLT